MAWTYTGDPSNSTRDKVRFLIPDTNADDPLFQDEEIDALLADEANAYYAAAMACDIQARKTGSVSSKKVGELSISYIWTAAEKWSKQASKLRSRGGMHKSISAGGVVESERETMKEDTSLIQPHITVGMHDNPASQDENSETSEE